LKKRRSVLESFCTGFHNWVAHLVPEQTVHMPDGFAGGDAAKMQVDLLQNLVARLQTELSKYVTPAEIDKAAEADPDLDLAVLSWQTSTEHISPLLTAYDGRIRELEAKLAESSHTRMDDRSLIEQLNQKNQKLTSELQKSMDGLIKKMEDAGTTTTGGAGSEEWKEQLDERDDMIQVLMMERELLQEHNSQMQVDLDQYRIALVDRDNDLTQNTRGLEQSISFVKKLEEEKAALLKHCTICQQKLQEATVHLTSEREMKRAYELKLEETDANAGAAQASE
jgi:chromosome segregation ATPase